jgi:GGDEF domain-containing protein
MRMRRPTLPWTDWHWLVAGLVALVCAGSLVGIVEGSPVALWVSGALTLAVAVALATDVGAGLVAGLAVAALLVVVRQLTGHWARADFGPALGETVAILAAAAWAGLVAQRIRRQVRSDGARDPDDGAGYDDLGLLGPSAARDRLEDEVAARDRDWGSLGLLLVSVRLIVDDRPPGVGDAAQRCFARLLQARTGPLDVPFALDANSFGVIFPHSTGRVVWDTVARLLDGVRSARVTVGPERRRVPLTQLVSVQVGICEEPAGAVTVQGLMGRAGAALASAESGTR